MFATGRTTMPLGQARQLQRPLAFLVLALFALSPLLVLLSGCGTPGTSNSAVAAPVAQAQSVRQGQVHLAPAPTISMAVRTAQRHLYLFSQSNVGLMQLAVDAQGNAWFAEQNANYIGHFDTRQQTFRIFPLGTWKGSPLGPQDLQFDGRSFLWFTAAEGGAIGRLDPRTGAIRLWPVPSSPSTLMLTPTERVWFGAEGAIGSLDPLTGQIILYALPNPQVQVFSMATDSTGHLWFTEVLPGKLAMFDPTTSTLTELSVPTLSGESPPALYALVIDHQQKIWFVDVGANMLLRYAPAKHSLTFFQLSLPTSDPFC